MMGRNWKATLLAVAFAGMAVVQPSFAKNAHGHQAHHVSAKAAPSGQSGNTKAANSVGKNSTDTIDLGVTTLPLRSAFPSDRARETKPSFKIAKPEDFPARRAEAGTAVVRNALGEPVARPAGGLAVGEHFGPPPPAVIAAPHTAVTVISTGNPDVGRQDFNGIASVRTPSRGKIDGAGLIRPSVAPSGLGGPAKTAAGINGTAFRPKR
jgi:hypothetical protein